MTNTTVLKLKNLAVSLEQHTVAEFRALAPKVHEAAHNIEIKSDEWLSLVDEYAEKWGDEAVHAAKTAAYAAYREACQIGNDLHTSINATLAGL